MTPPSYPEWTEADFGQISWHDNHIHAIKIVEGRHGVGELTLDVDFILEWVTSDEGFEFVIAPADLVFHEVSGLRMEIDYNAMSAAMMPFSIQGVDRRFHEREGYTAKMWTLEINFPRGCLEFEASGFTQRLRGRPRRSKEQVLSEEQRR